MPRGSMPRATLTRFSARAMTAVRDVDDSGCHRRDVSPQCREGALRGGAIQPYRVRDRVCGIEPAEDQAGVR